MYYISEIEYILTFFLYICIKLFYTAIMKLNHLEEKSVQTEEKQMAQPAKRKKFHGFSMGFLLILLALMVGVYIVCLMVAG